MIKEDFHSLANSTIRNVTPYQPGKPIEEVERELGITSAIKLASNENPLGASPAAIHAAQQAALKIYFYPDAGCYVIKKSLANFLNIDTTQLTMGNGSENILELIIKSYLTSHDSAVISQYAFLTIPLLINSYGAELITSPARSFGHDIHKMIAAIKKNTRIVFIVNPNNPTGTYTNEKELLFLLNSIPKNILIVIDEAYYEYINQDDYPNTVALLNHYPNLIITRTFSKAYGLAGLRLGYAISSPDIADILNRARLPFNVNNIVICSAQAALLDQEHIQKSIALIHQGMLHLEEEFKSLKIDYIPSLGNFITLNTKQDARNVYQNLLYQGVIVRPLHAYDMPTYLRVTIGTHEQNEKLLQALKTVLQRK